MYYTGIDLHRRTSYLNLASVEFAEDARHRPLAVGDYSCAVDALHLR